MKTSSATTPRNRSSVSIARLLGMLGALLSLTVMLGWHTHTDFLVQLRPDLESMSYNSALMLLISSTGLLLLCYQYTSWARFCAGASLLFSAVTMLQYFLGTDFGIDQLFALDHLANSESSSPGRMALSSAFCYMMLSTGVMIYTLEQGRWHTRTLATVGAAIVIAVVIAILIGYRSNLQPLFGWSASTVMALQTALGLFMVSTGLLIHCLNSDGEPGEYDHLSMAAAGFIVIATSSLLVWSGLTRQRDEQRQNDLASNVRLLSSGIGGLYIEHINALDRMAMRWQAGGGTSEAIWNMDSAGYLESLPALQAISWLTTTGSLARTFSKEDSLMQGWQLAPEWLSEACLAINNTNSGEFTSPLVEREENDAHYFYVLPLTSNSVFNGCLVAEISTLPLFQAVNLQTLGVPYYVEQDNARIYTSPQASLRESESITQEVNLSVASGGWTLVVSDRNTSGNLYSILPFASLTFGMLLATLFALILGLWGISRRRLIQKEAANVALENSKRLLNEFRTTLDRTLDCVFMLDAETLTYYYANAGALQLTGLSYAEIIGKRPWEANSRTTEARFRQHIEPLLSLEVDSITYDTFQRHRDGRETPVECFLQYIAPDKEKPRFVALLRDITERRRVEQMKSEFVSTVSHELRTPLTSITGALGLVKGGALGEVSAPAQEMVDIAFQNGRRLTHLINDLLDIERLAAGRINFDFQQQPLMPLVKQAVEDISTYGSENNIGVQLLKEESGIEVRVDGQRLLQILGNLLSNAIKFSPAGAKVEVSVERADARVRISVRDYGRGIPEEFKSRIFQKFAQADSSDTRRHSGTGLGLAISRELAERMGGALAFYSKAGEGSCFYVELPIGIASAT